MEISGPRRRWWWRIATLALVLASVAGTGAGQASTASTASTGSTAAPQAHDRRAVVSRDVVFDLTNTGDSLLSCLADQQRHTVRGRLVGPRQDVLGHGGPLRVNVLVHDLGTGGWFWNLRRIPEVDYATRLGARGETSLVLDRLGYDRSPLADGDATCLDAQAFMLHQVVQHLYSGIYEYDGGRGLTPHASSVVLHGHGVGAAIGQLEASRFDDVAGLVQMSWAAGDGTRTEQDQDRRQAQGCTRDGGFVSYGSDVRDFRRLLFTTASPAVQRQASRRRNSTPCGDVRSLPGVVATSRQTAARVEVPVLVLGGTGDSRFGEDAFASYAASFSSSPRVRTALVEGAGSALPLEASAVSTRALVVRWLRLLGPASPGRVR